MKAAILIQLQGYPPAYRDIRVLLEHEASGKKLERSPQKDGKLLIRDIPPGYWQVEIKHPNLALAVYDRRVRVFDQREPTLVPVIVMPELFQDTQIEDSFPEMSLAPVQEMADEVSALLAPISSKSGGEVIKAGDWNTLVGSVATLATAVAELTRVVSPQGHDHPEYEAQFATILRELRIFSEAFGNSLLELQRQIELASIENQVKDALDEAGASEDQKDRVSGKFDGLRANLQANPKLYTGQLAGTGNQILTVMNELAASMGSEADEFFAKPNVQTVMHKATEYSQSGIQKSQADELQMYKRTSSKEKAGTKFANATKKPAMGG